MEEMDLINVLDDLADEEFANFKWYLKKESWNGIPAIKTHLVTKAERRDAVDLMMQKYELHGAVQVMQSILKKISRNDLVSQLQATASKDSGPAETLSSTGEANTPEAKLTSVRSEFIDRVSDPVLLKLLDKLLDQRVITDNEVESAGANRAEKARYVIDMARRKGSRASSVLIAALIDVDSCLSEQLNLK